MASPPRLAFLFLAVTSWLCSHCVNAVTPVEKVIELLEGLKEQVEKEGKTEAASYEEFACFCKDATASKSTAIKSEKDDIDLLAANQMESAALIEAKQSELQERLVKYQKLTEQLKEKKQICVEDHELYAAENADLTKSILGLTAALASMQKSKPEAAFLAVKSTSKRMGLGALAAILQRAAASRKTAKAEAAVDPDDPEYKFHSEDIVTTITSLLEDFQKKKGTADEEWAKTKKVCTDTQAAISEELKTNADAMETLKVDIDTTKTRMAQFHEQLVQAENLLKADKLYLTDLTADCEHRAKEYDQRTTLREGELDALSEALDIMKNKVASADESVNERALLFSQGKSIGINASPSLLQRGATATDLRTVKRHSSMEQVRQERVTDLLRAEGARLKSVSLRALATRSAADPFKKVKNLIQQLIERLVAEAIAETEKKGFCDEQMGTLTQERDFRMEEVTSLNAEIRTLEAKVGLFKEQNMEMNSATASMNDALNESAVQREEEKNANLEALQEAKEGLEAVNSAIAILKDFYKEASKAEVSFMQQERRASPIEEDTSGPGFDGAYKGKQAASKGIIGTLEVIKSDFERTVSTTEAAEKKATKDYQEFKTATRVDVTGKTRKAELNAEDVKAMELKLTSKMDELQKTMDLVGNTLQALEDIKSQCVDNVMSTEDRVAKREEEIEALKKALCMLDPENVEEICRTVTIG